MPLVSDVVLIVDTFHHIENRIEYLRKLRDGLRKGGLLVIVDFKKERTEVGPPLEFRFSEDQVQSELQAAGYAVVSTDRDTLPYQYLIKAHQ